MVVQAEDRGDVVAGRDALLIQEEDAVRDAVGEFGLLGVEIGQGADGSALGVVGHEIPGVEIGAGGLQLRFAAAGAKLHGIAAVGRALAGFHPGTDHGAEDLVAGPDIRGKGGLVLLQGVIVVQQGGGGNNGVGVVMLGGEAQLPERAQHTVGQHAPELALFDPDAAGEQRLVLRHGHEIAGVDVPRAGDDLEGRILAHVQLADPHMVAVRMALHGEDAAHHHVFQGFIQDFRDLHLGAGEGHGLGEIPVAHLGYVHELVEPFTGKFHISTSVGLKIKNHGCAGEGVQGKVPVPFPSPPAAKEASSFSPRRAPGGFSCPWGAIPPLCAAKMLCPSRPGRHRLGPMSLTGNRRGAKSPFSF